MAGLLGDLAAATSHIATHPGHVPSGPSVPQHAPGRSPVPNRAQRSGASARLLPQQPSFAQRYFSSGGSAPINPAAYRQAVISTYLHQSAHQQQAIVKGALARPSLEGSMILQHLGGAEGGAIKGLSARDITGGKTVSGPLKTVTSLGGGSPIAAVTGAITHPGQTLDAAGKILEHSASDLLHLAPNTAKGIYNLGAATVEGRFGDVAHMLVDPYVAFFNNPGKTFEEHPLNTALLGAGAVSGVGRLAGATARSGVLGRGAAAAASQTRAPLELIPGATPKQAALVESRIYSPNVMTKGLQVAGENFKRGKGKNPNVAQMSSHVAPSVVRTFHIGTEGKLQRKANEMSAVHQMSRREAGAEGKGAVHKVRPPAQVQNIVSLILQNVVRPHNPLHDLQAEINRLKANRHTNPRSYDSLQNRRQVKDLTLAMKNPQLLQRAFATADQLRPHGIAADALLLQKHLLDPEQALRAKLFPYAQAHMAAKYDFGLKPGDAKRMIEESRPARLVGPTGEHLPNEAILAHLREAGLPEPMFVGHNIVPTDVRNFYKAWKASRGGLPTGPKGRRTGEAFRTGAWDHSYDALVVQAARTAELVQRSTLHDRIVTQAGLLMPKELRKPNNKTGMFTPDEARRFAEQHHITNEGVTKEGQVPLVPLTTGARGIDLTQLQHPAEMHVHDQLELTALDRALQDAATRKGGPRNVVLVPKPFLDTMLAQFRSGSDAGRAFGRFTQQFRRTVLPYSTHWFVQNITESALRSMLTGSVNPVFLARGRRLMGELQKTEEGRTALREMVNMTFYHKHDPLMRTNPNPGLIANAVHTVPPVKQIVAAHNAYANRVGHLSHLVEKQFRVMQLGKLVGPDLHAFFRAYEGGVRIQGRTMADFAHRLQTDPALVTRYGRAVDDALGKYNKLGPTLRATVQVVAPFLPWFLTAARFVFFNLPKQHPVASSLLASLRQTVEQDQKMGKTSPLDKFQLAAFAKMTPFGIIGQNVKETLLSPFLPEFTGPANVLSGQNVFGDRTLRGPHGQVKGEAEKAGLAAYSLFESIVPAARLLRTAQEGGSSPYDTSWLLNPQTKPGTKHGSALNRMFNPFRGIQTKTPPKKTGRKSSAGWGDSSSSSSGGWGTGGSTAPSSGNGGWG